MQRVLVLVLGAMAYVSLSLAHGQLLPRRLYDGTDVRGGLVVIVGETDSDYLRSFRTNERYLVHNLLTDEAKLAQCRESLLTGPGYGVVSAAPWDGKRLPYADNLVTLLVLSGPQPVPAPEEIERVLSPRGVAISTVPDHLPAGATGMTGALAGYHVYRKPVPGDIDDWTHFLHGADGNAVSKDTVVGPPRRIQWQAGPKAGKNHDVSSSSVMVTSNGRVFYDIDEGLREADRISTQWVIVARDAFNGILLWKRHVPKWGVEFERHVPPIQMQRRMVCDGDSLYLKEGVGLPVHRLDGATGDILQTYPGTEEVEEVVYADGVLYAVAWQHLPDVVLGQRNKRLDAYGRERELGPILGEDVETRALAIDAASGTQLWAKTFPKILPHSMAVCGGQAYFKTSERLYCVDARTGTDKWHYDVGHPYKHELSRDKYTTSMFKVPWTCSVWNYQVVVALPEIVLVGSAKKITALSAVDGKFLWDGPGAKGFFNPPEVMVVGDTVWAGYQPFDLRAGKPGVKAEVFGGGMSHHRCYKKKATERFLLASEAGVEFYEFKSGEQFPNHWVRGDCMIGVLPANGLLYSTPNPCACFNAVKLNGVLSLAPAAGPTATPHENGILEKGPAYGRKLKLPSGDDADAWPTYRQNNRRNGATAAKVGSRVKSLWSVQLHSCLTPPTIASGAVYLAETDKHTVHAFNAQSGAPLWSYTAGARVDGPPTLFSNFAVFGCRDGWVYCLDAADGTLVYRFHGGPYERLIGNESRLESAWPVHGSVLVAKNPETNARRPTVYFAAGNNSFADNGVYVYGLDLETGEVMARNLQYGPVTDEGNPIVNGGFSIDGVMADILSSDDDHIFMRTKAFNANCDPVTGPVKAHLISTGQTLLDATWFHRAYWSLDVKSGYKPGNNAFGDILVFDDERIFSVSTYTGGRTSRWHPQIGYTFKAHSYQHVSSGTPEPVEAADKLSTGKGSAGKRKRLTTSDFIHVSSLWTQNVDIAVKAMVLVNTKGSESAIFVAGPHNPGDSQGFLDALAGKHGAILRRFSAKDGNAYGDFELDALPVFDGLAAAYGKLYISLANGKLICLGE